MEGYALAREGEMEGCTLGVEIEGTKIPNGRCTMSATFAFWGTDDQGGEMPTYAITASVEDVEGIFFVVPEVDVVPLMFASLLEGYLPR